MINPQYRGSVLLAITKSNWGGAQRYVYDVALGMRERGYDVAVAVGGDGPLIGRLVDAGISIERLGAAQRDVSIGRDFATLVDLVKVIKRRRPDVVHVNSAKIGGLGAFAARLLGVPRIVFTAHGLAFNEDRSPLSKAMIKFFTWLTIVLSHVTIAVSEGLREQMAHWPFAERRFVVVRNALRPQSLVPRDEARRRLVGDRSFSMLIGTIAELHPIKGLEYMIRAISFLRGSKDNAWSDVGYVVMGEGHDRTRLEALISDLGLGGTVILAGHVTDASSYLSALDVYVMPSISEGLAYASLEAGAAGLPCIASNVGGLPEVIADGVTGLLVPPRDVPALVAALERFRTDPDVARAYGDALRESILDRFSIDGMMDGTLRAYQR